MQIVCFLCFCLFDMFSSQELFNLYGGITIADKGLQQSEYIWHSLAIEQYEVTSLETQDVRFN